MRALLFILSLIGITACGGGGGGGGEGRTTDTALRIVHGAIDATPVTAIVEEVLVPSTGYAQPSEYVRVEEGRQTIIVQRTNEPGTVVARITAELESNTEYSLFLLGNVGDGSFRVSLITEPVVQPEGGNANVQILNSYFGSSSINVVAGDVALRSTAFGGSSGFVEFPVGPQTFRISDSDGEVLGNVTLDLPERGEVTLHVTGSKELGVSFIKALSDLD